MLVGFPPVTLLPCTRFSIGCLSIVVTLLGIPALLARWLVSVVDTPPATSSYIVMDLLKLTLVITVDYILMRLSWTRQLMPSVNVLGMLNYVHVCCFGFASKWLSVSRCHASSPRHESLALRLSSLIISHASKISPHYCF